MLSRRAAIATALLGALLIGVALLVDWEALARTSIERRLEAYTGREVTLERVRLRWGLPIGIELHGVSIANARWARDEHLLRADIVAARVRILPLLFKRQLVLPQVALAGPWISLEQSEGRRNWVFDRSERADSSGDIRVQVHTLSIVSGTLKYRDREANTDLLVHADQDEGERRDGRVFVFDARGAYRGERVEANGAGASLLRLREASEPYPLRVNVAVGATSARFEGAVLNPAQLESIDGDFALKGATPSHLYRLIGIPLPDTPPYRLRGRLQHQGGVWRYRDFEGRMGDSDLSGSVFFDTRPEPPMLEAQLTSQLLDFDDLAPLIGAPPKTGPGEQASPAQKREAARRRAEPTVLPRRGFNTERWRKLNADATLAAKKVRRSKALPIDDLSARLRLRDGVLELTPLRFGVAGGTVDSTIRLDGREDPLAARLDTRFSGLRLDRMFPTVPRAGKSAGAFFGDASLDARGDSVKSLLATADGRLYLAMGPGEVSNVLLEAVGLDAGEIIKFLATGDRLVRVRCAVGNFGVEDGVASTRALVIATGDSNVVGAGRIDMRRERLDLTLHVAPKDMSVLAARAPLHVQGTFKDPSVTPDVGVLAAKGGAALLLALVNPVLALVPLVETGPGKESSCGELVAEARGWRPAKDSAARAARRDTPAEATAAREAEGEGAARPPDLPRAERPRSKGKAPAGEIAPRVEDLR
ncbi:MAG TPA: AsmA family protein [Burkholderiales bacterium]|nr:AsmA family protein [Burkholderiales bacterium]